MTTIKVHAPPHVCYHVKFGSSLTKGVSVNRRELPKLGSGGGRRPLTVGAWLTPKFSPHTCYRVTFGSAASKGVCINRREPPKFGSVVASLPGGRGVADPLEIRPSLTCYPAEFGRSRSNDTSVIKEILLKF